MPHVFIAVAQFYRDIAEELTRGATEYLKKQNVTFDVVEVPGAFELPSAVRMAIASGRYGGYVALGCVVRGETTHYDYVCAESARGLSHLALKFAVPIGYGILTVETMEQAWVRAATTQGDKGGQAAEAMLKMYELGSQLGVAG